MANELSCWCWHPRSDHEDYSCSKCQQEKILDRDYDNYPFHQFFEDPVSLKWGKEEYREEYWESYNLNKIGRTHEDLLFVLKKCGKTRGHMRDSPFSELRERFGFIYQEVEKLGRNYRARMYDRWSEWPVLEQVIKKWSDEVGWDNGGCILDSADTWLIDHVLAQDPKENIHDYWKLAFESLFETFFSTSPNVTEYVIEHLDFSSAGAQLGQAISEVEGPWDHEDWDQEEPSKELMVFFLEITMPDTSDNAWTQDTEETDDTEVFEGGYDDFEKWVMLPGINQISTEIKKLLYSDVMDGRKL